MDSEPTASWCIRLCGRPAGGRPQLPELQPAEKHRQGDGRLPQDGAVQARFRRHHRRVAGRHRLHHRWKATTTWCCASAASARSRRPRASRWTSRPCPVIHKQSRCYPVCIDVSHPAGQFATWCPVAGAAPPWPPGADSHHDRGAPQPAGGAFRRPAAADSGAVPRPGRASCARSPRCSGRRSSNGREAFCIM